MNLWKYRPARLEGRAVAILKLFDNSFEIR